MKLLFLIICISFIKTTSAQNTTQRALFKIPITSYIEKTNDSSVIVQIQLQPFTNLEIKDKTVAILKHSYATNKENDSTTLAVGKCYLIKGDYYYFGMTLKTAEVPVGGDLLMLMVTHRTCYNGLLYDMTRNGIKFQTVDEKDFYNYETPLLLNDEKEEEKYMNHMIADIKNTAVLMLKEMPNANQVIDGGLYNGVKLFEAMQKTTLYDLKEFIKYMKARPTKYAGQKWKISEIYATWLTSETPRVLEK